MAIAIFDIPIPVVVNENGTLKEGYALYVESGGMLSNDSWTVVHTEGGVVRHYLTSEVFVQYNGTYGIKPKSNEQKDK